MGQITTTTTTTACDYLLVPESIELENSSVNFLLWTAVRQKQRHLSSWACWDQQVKRLAVWLGHRTGWSTDRYL